MQISKRRWAVCPAVQIKRLNGSTPSSKINFASPHLDRTGFVTPMQNKCFGSFGYCIFSQGSGKNDSSCFAVLCASGQKVLSQPIGDFTHAKFR